MSDILFKEGAMHSVVINIPVEINLTGYKAKIQVRKSVTASIIDFEFNTENATLNIVGQQILLQIPANLTDNKDGDYLWQLMIYTNTADAIKFAIGKFIILPSITV